MWKAIRTFHNVRNIEACGYSRGLVIRTTVPSLTKNSCHVSGRGHERWYCSSPEFQSSPVTKVVLPPLEPVENSVDTVTSDASYSGVSFSEISGLSKNMVHRLNRLGFKHAFEVQAETLPYTLNGRDVIGRAVTGSGKTLAFAIPIIEKLSTSKRSLTPRAIAITPTRELCRQVSQAIASLSDNLHCTSLYGGDSYARQERDLRRGSDVVCATPGRLNDHYKRGNLLLNDVQFLILDEADELLTPNFKLQIEDILNDTPREKQMMLFSATMPFNIQQLIGEHMSNPVTIDLVKDKSTVPTSVAHEVMMVDPHIRDKVAVNLIHTRNPQRAIIFTQTKREASSLGRFLVSNGISAAGLHSDLSQSVRESCLESFRNGSIKVIAATDVAARGIDIPEIDLVIQCGTPPSGIDYYIHRSGRTGRKGQSGTSLLLLSRSFEAREFLHELRRKSINFREIDPPSGNEITSASLDSAVSAVVKVDPELTDMARTRAEELTETHGIDALASALAIIANLRNSTSSFHERSRSYGGTRYRVDSEGFGQGYHGQNQYRADSRRRDFGLGRRGDYGSGRRGEYGSGRRGDYRSGRRGDYGSGRRGDYGDRDHFVRR